MAVDPVHVSEVKDHCHVVRSNFYWVVTMMLPPSETYPEACSPLMLGFEALEGSLLSLEDHSVVGEFHSNFLHRYHSPASPRSFPFS